MIQIKKADGTCCEVKKDIYNAIKGHLNMCALKGKWLTYGKVFSSIKPKLVVDIGEAVWFVAPVLESLVQEGTVLTKEEDGLQLYYIENKEF